jgi:hypothetical protein
MQMKRAQAELICNYLRLFSIQVFAGLDITLEKQRGKDSKKGKPQNSIAA